jgi:hypothetical protein
VYNDGRVWERARRSLCGVQVGEWISSKVDSPGFYGFHGLPGIHLVIQFDECWCMDLIGVFPSVVAFRVTFPFDQILQGLALPPGLVGMYLLHFVLFFSINQIRWWLGEVGAV